MNLPNDMGAVRRDAPLAPLSTWRIGGPADLLVEPDSERAVESAVRFAAARRLPLVVIGAASNILFDDAGVRGMVLRLAGMMSARRFDGEMIDAQAGAMLPALARAAADAGLAGLEDLAGVPGTLGGAIAMNGGVPEHPIGARVAEVRTVGRDGLRRVFEESDCRFGYRTSRFAGGSEIVVGARLRAAADDPAAVRARTAALAGERRRKFPLDVPSAGSVFLRSAEIPSPGRAIEEAGLKGKAVGAAAVSGKHANFIVNTGGATSADVLSLIRQVRLAVRAATGYWMKTEVRYVRPDGVEESPAGAEAPDEG